VSVPPGFPRPPAAVLCDLDGTLLDSEPLHRLTAQDVLLAHGHEPASVDDLPVGCSDEMFWNEMRARLGLAAAPEELALQRSEAFARRLAMAEVRLPVRPGVERFVEALLRLDVPHMVVSSSPAKQIEGMLRAADLLGTFGRWISGHDDVPRTKPHPDVYAAAARALGVEPARCLAVEDSGLGVASAAAAGCFVVVVPSDAAGDTGLERAHLRLASLAELADLLAEVEGAGPRA